MPDYEGIPAWCRNGCFRPKTEEISDLKKRIAGLEKERASHIDAMSTVLDEWKRDVEKIEAERDEARRLVEKVDATRGYTNHGISVKACTAAVKRWNGSK
jgi:hypothetical protein